MLKINGGYKSFASHRKLKNKLNYGYSVDLRTLTNFLKEYPNSVNYHNFAIRTLKEAYPSEFVKGCIRFQGRKQDNPNIRGLDIETVESIRNKIINTETNWKHYFLHVFDTLIETGWRLSELCSIDWKNVKITGMSDTTYEIPYIASKRHVDRIKPLRIALFNYWIEHQYDYKNQYKRIQRMFNEFKRIWQLPTNMKLTAHIMRHTATSIAIDKGISAEQVSYFTDHVDTRTTMKVYYKSSTALKNVANVLQRHEHKPQLQLSFKQPQGVKN